MGSPSGALQRNNNIVRYCIYSFGLMVYSRYIGSQVNQFDLLMRGGRTKGEKGGFAKILSGDYGGKKDKRWEDGHD